MKKEYRNLMTNPDKDVFIPLGPSVLNAMLMSKVSRQKEGFRDDLIHMVEEDLVNLPDEDILSQFKNSFVVANGFMEKWGVNYGHSSIKELDHIQMCLENRSRWFTEIIETLHNNQYWSYIEYSLRYNPPKDFVIPSELDQAPSLREAYLDFCRYAFLQYGKLQDEFQALLAERYPEESESAIKKLAFENARNVLPLSTKANMGLAVNLRAFCDGLSELLCHSNFSSEISETAMLMKEEGEIVSPGMVRHADPTPYLQSYIDEFYQPVEVPTEKKRKIYQHPVVEVTGEFDIQRMKNMRGVGDLNLMTRFSNAPTTFKTIGKDVSLLMSEACHHQFIRHRTFDYLTYLPNVDFGLLLPPELAKDREHPVAKSIEETLIAVYKRSCVVYDQLMDAGLIGVAPYVVINANMRQLDFFGNLFAMTRFITLRTEKHAQDEIRSIAHQLDDAYQEIDTLIPGFHVNRQLD